MTIGELLKAKDFSKLRVINNNADLDREIDTVESTETPDVARYVPKNTLVLTTAMVFEDNQKGLCELIYSLNELPCAGLAVKVGRFIHDIHPDVVAVADELGFPLLQIPLEATLGEIYHQMLSYMWDNKNEDLNYALNTQKKFSNLILQGASMKVMLNNLGLTLQKPVAILSPFGDVHESNYACTKENLAVARESFESLSLYERRDSEIQYYLDEERGTDRISIYPIRVVGRNTYYLYVFHSEQLSVTISTLVVEQVLLIFGISLYKNLYLLYNTIKHKEDFLNILVNKYKKEHWSAQQMLTIGEKFGLKACTRYRIIMANLDPQGDKKFDSINFAYREERFILIYNWLEKILRGLYHGDILVFPEPSNYRYVMLIQGNPKDLDMKLAKFHATLEKVFQVELVFSCGNYMFDLESIGHSYRESIESYRDGEERDGISCIKYYRPQNVVELLKTVSNDQIEGICMYTLKNLAYPKDEMMLELRKTLRTYLDCRCSITETANRMFLHRNTIKYRIKKCEEILGRDFGDSDYCFQLQLSMILAENK